MSQLEFIFEEQGNTSIRGLNGEIVLDVFGAAKYLKLSPKTIRCYARDRKIPAKKIGSQWRFLKPVLDRWLSGEYSVLEQKPAGVVLTSENKVCRYSKEMTSIGSILDTKDEEYESLLEL